MGQLPAWVRRRDGSQVPFDADRICQSLYAAAESLGPASAFLMRELTDAVVHFLARSDASGVPTTDDIAEHVEKIVRELGHPDVARRFGEQHRDHGAATPKESASPMAVNMSPQRFVHDCAEAFAVRTIFSRDVAAAVAEGLLHPAGLDAPASLSALVLETNRLAEIPWWLALDDWRACAGARWVVESPEWLCAGHAHPAMTPHLCDRLLSLPTLGQRDVELHLNVREPPFWSSAHPARPLFASSEDEATSLERANFLDGLVERWKSLHAPRLPTLAWHVHERSFRDDTERRQLQNMLREALLGKAVRFIFDRPRGSITLAEGLDRKCPGVLMEIGLDLGALAYRPEVERDGATLLKKLPSLVRLAVSAAGQKRQYLRRLPESSPLKRRFLVARSAAVFTPRGLDEAVVHLTGESLLKSPLSFDFAMRILDAIKRALHESGRSINFDLRIDSSALPFADATVAPKKQLELGGKLHARAGAGTMTLLLADGSLNADALVDLLQTALNETAVSRLHLQRARTVVQQGELAI